MMTVFIKGLGLIGSSLARAIKRVHPSYKIMASDIDSAVIEYALANGVIDEGVTGFRGVSQADFIILASPVSQIITDITALAREPLKAGVIVTDVGSTKATIMAAAKQLASNKVTFIGGHPMAGSHKSGVTAGKADLIENAYYFLIPLADGKGVDELKDLLAGTGAKWLLTDVSKHDLIVTQISDLPHVIAAALVNNTEDVFAADPLGMRVAAGGFKSVTRIAASNPVMWSAIMMNNQRLITTHLQSYIDDLAQIKELIAAGDKQAIHQFFTRAKAGRESLNATTRAPFYDLFLNIPDRPGEIARVTHAVAAAGISLVNLQILEVREDINGILQLVFAREDERERAATVLKKDYEIVTR